MHFRLVYPERRWVTADQIERWYLDAIANGLVPLGEDRARTPIDMAKALEDIGHITVASYREAVS